MMDKNLLQAISKATGVDEHAVSNVVCELRSHKEKEPRWGLWMLSIGLLVLLVLAVIAGLQFWFVSEIKTGSEGDGLTKFGISGDFFGFANALFSALAFAMIIVTLWMQKYELKQQRIELDQTQNIMTMQQEEMKQQNESLKNQEVTNTFFKMLELHGEIVQGLTVKRADGLLDGRRVFPHLLQELGAKFREPKYKDENQSEIYSRWHRGQESLVGHYFRTLYNTLRFVDENGGENSETYARLIRAQLSGNELELLLYNGASEWGNKKFKPLIEKYSLLKHLKDDPAFNDWKSKYEPSAFGMKKAEA